MMRSSSHSAEATDYESVRRIVSKSCEGVVFTVSRMSFGRRIELTRRIGELGSKIEFLEAGEQVRDKLESSLLAHEIDKIYIEWGLLAVDGLMIDGAAATPDTLVEKGPEEICREAVEAVKSECGLAENERKNS